MLSETVVSTFLTASITGAGLVLAIYALITPISEKIFRERAKRLDYLIEKFEQEKSKLTADSSNKDFKHLNSLKDEIKQIRIFPRYLGVGVLLTFFLFMFGVIADFFWLAQPLNQVPANDVYIHAFFIFAVGSFMLIGLLTASEIFYTMRKDYEEVKKKQKEAKKNISESDFGTH